MVDLKPVIVKIN